MKNRKQQGSWYLNSKKRKTKIMKTSKKQSLLLSILLKSSDQKISKNLIVYFLDNKYLLLMCLKNLLIYESPISQFWELQEIYIIFLRLNLYMKLYQTMQMKKLCFRLKWEATTRVVLCKKVFLENSQNSQENTCARVSFLINFIKKEALAQVFSCECWEIFKNTFFIEHQSK